MYVGNRWDKVSMDELSSKQTHASKTASEYIETLETGMQVPDHFVISSDDPTINIKLEDDQVCIFKLLVN